MYAPSRYFILLTHRFVNIGMARNSKPYFQFKRYYESNEDIPAPIKLEMCISLTGGQVTATEPLVSYI